MRYRIIPAAIAITILMAIIISANPAVLAGELAKSDLRLVAAAMLVSTAGAAFRVLKWSVLVGVGPVRLAPVQLLGVTISNFTPGKLAEPAKAVLLKMHQGVNVSRTLPSIIWERINDLIVLIALSAIAIQSLTLETNLLYIGFASILVFAAMIAMFVLVLKSERFGTRMFRLARRLPVLNRISENFIHAFYKNRIRKRTVLKSLVITIIPWTLEGYIFYFSLLAVGLEADPLMLAGIVALAALIGVLSSLPGGIGSSEAVMLVLLGVTGLSGSKAVAGMILFRFLSFWYFSFLGFLSFIYLSRRLDVKGVLK